MIRASSLCLGLLGSALIMCSGSSSTSSTTCDSGYSGYYDPFQADGWCDYALNNAECGYDGGDCCECTCVDASYPCGYVGFACIDPAASCVDDDYITAEIAESCYNGGGYVSDVGNGYCNESNNIEECDYDGGDCCECTCGDESGDLDDSSCTDFACIDPNAPCVDDITDGMFEGCFNFGDGFCDDYNNNEQCGYDGGDCCECTCVVSTLWSTESSCTEFACIDPTAPCADDDDITANAVGSCIIDYLGNGICDTSNNIEICGYDGGDCCECTCGYDSTDVLDGSCSDFACVDPTASCFDESITVDMFENCDAELLGDGYCQESNNNEICDYDFGDCCESTCGVDFSEPLDEFACSSFACIDPRFVTQSPTPAPLSSECPGGSSCVDGAGGQSVDVPDMLESATNQGFIAAGVITLFNLFYLTCCRKDKEDDEVHCYLLLMAYVFSVAEGICVVLLVPNSKENLKIEAVFLFGAVAALSGFLLRKAGRHVTAAIVNAGLEGLFAASVLFYFVELSTRNIFLFGAIAGNEALVGFAIAVRVDSRPNSDESSFETSFEIGVLVGEAVGDVIFPLVATLIQSLFHRNSAWRSDFVFTWWAITGFANTSAICMCLVPPVKKIVFGPKLACLTQFFFNGSMGVMAFVILTLTEVNIADPPTFDIVWSSVVGTVGVLGGCASWLAFKQIQDIPDGHSIQASAPELPDQ